MKGFVPTPAGTVDLMIGKLFDCAPPTASSAVLDPGCGTGAFIEGVARWCRRHDRPMPRVVGIEQDAKHLDELTQRIRDVDSVEIRHEDFLSRKPSESFDYIIGNPPYVPITKLTEVEKESYRSRFAAARGRFDLYQLFFEQALRSLGSGGRMVFITPEKFAYVETATTLRQFLTACTVSELHFLDEQTFGGLVTYPLITTVVNRQPKKPTTHVVSREGRITETRLPDDGSSWLPALNGEVIAHTGKTLADLCERISCGVATGADAIYIRPTNDLGDLAEFAHPTVAGRELVADQDPQGQHSMLIPYDEAGALMEENHLGALGDFLTRSENKDRLMKRTCVKRKPWYAFHENPPMRAIRRPKLICKDIASTPFFVCDRLGMLVPRHSVYYLVPKNPAILGDLEVYLNSPKVREWLTTHCQRAANGFLRLQSHILKNVPVPDTFPTDN